MRKWLFLLVGIALLAGLTTTATLASEKHPLVYNPSPQPKPDADFGRYDLLAESFEGVFPPVGWAVLQEGVSTTWVKTTAAAHSGLYSAGVLYGPVGQPQDEWLVTPPLDFTGYSIVRVEWYEDENYWADYGEHHYIAVSATSQTDPTAFTMIEDMTPGNHNVPGMDGDPVTVDLSAYAGESQVYVAFRYTGTWADNWFVDDVRVFEPWAHDVKVISVTPDGEQYAGGSTMNPQVGVKNLGLNSETFEVNLEISESGTPVYSQNVSVVNLFPDEQRVVNLPPLTLNAGQYYLLAASAVLPGDMDESNNSRDALDDTYTLDHVPLGLLVTNWGCDPCVQANQAMDTYMEQQSDNVALMRVHCWWPSNTDPIYNANPEQCTDLIEGTPTGSDYAPHLWIDGIVDAGSSGSAYAALFNQRQQYKSPMTVEQVWYPTDQILMVRVTVVEPLPPGDYRLRVAITEDNVYALGPNGEPYHDQAFRHMYPTTAGLPVSSGLGVQIFYVHCEIDPAWAYGQLRATSYVQDMGSGKVHEALSSFLTDDPVSEVATPDQPAITELVAARPNPFNPKMTVAFTVNRAQRVRLSVFDMMGRRVDELADEVYESGRHSVEWDGVDTAGRAVASGTYVVRLEAKGKMDSRSVVLVR